MLSILYAIALERLSQTLVHFIGYGTIQKLNFNENKEIVYRHLSVSQWKQNYPHSLMKSAMQIFNWLIFCASGTYRYVKIVYAGDVRLDRIYWYWFGLAIYAPNECVCVYFYYMCVHHIITRCQRFGKNLKRF